MRTRPAVSSLRASAIVIAFAFVCFSACTSGNSLAPSTSPQRLIGFVTESSPTETTSIAGAQVEIASGAHRGAVALSDKTGLYQFQISGECDLVISREGYQTKHVHAADGAARADVQLTPMPRDVDEIVTGDWDPKLSVTFPVHNPGMIVVRDISIWGFEEGDGVVIDILDGQRVVAQSFVERSFPRSMTALSVAVSGGRMYSVRFTASGSSHAERATVSHPN